MIRYLIVLCFIGWLPIAAQAAPETIVCKAFSSRGSTTGNQVIQIDDASQNVDIPDGYKAGNVQVTEYDAGVIAFTETFYGSGGNVAYKYYYHIDRVTGDFVINMGGNNIMDGKCVKATKRF